MISAAWSVVLSSCSLCPGDITVTEHTEASPQWTTLYKRHFDRKSFSWETVVQIIVSIPGVFFQILPKFVPKCSMYKTLDQVMAWHRTFYISQNILFIYIWTLTNMILVCHLFYNTITTRTITWQSSPHVDCLSLRLSPFTGVLPLTTLSGGRYQVAIHSALYPSSRRHLLVDVSRLILWPISPFMLWTFTWNSRYIWYFMKLHNLNFGPFFNPNFPRASTAVRERGHPPTTLKLDMCSLKSKAKLCVSRSSGH